MGELRRAQTRDTEALPFLRRAMELSPDRSLEEAYNRCRDYLIRPTYPMCFREAVERTWEMFLGEEKQLYATLVWKPEEDSAFNRLWDILDTALRLPYLYLESREKKVHVFLRLDGDLSRVFGMYYFCQRAPKGIEERWVFHIGLEQDLKAVPADIRVWVDEDKKSHNYAFSPQQERRVKLAVESTSIDRSDPAAMNLYREAVANALGEIAALWSVSTITFAGRNRKRPSIPLRQLETELRSMGVGMVEDAETLMDCWYVYRVGGEGPHMGLSSGRCRWGAFLDDFYANRTAMADRLQSFGITPGFFSIEKVSSRQYTAATLMSLEVGLRERTDSGDYLVLGWGLGDDTVVLDVLMWDTEAVLKAAEKVTALPNLGRLRFQTYRKGIQDFPLAGYSRRRHFF